MNNDVLYFISVLDQFEATSENQTSFMFYVLLGESY